MTSIITCPSGLSGRVRGLKTSEERVLADRKLAKAGAQLDRILASCWEETLDPGIYPITGAPDWGAVLQGDRFYALLAIRIATYGPDYSFRAKCADRSCRARIDWEISLSDLPIQTLSERSRRTFLSGNRFESVLPSSGQKVGWKLLTGADERALGMLTKASEQQPISTGLNLRIVDIEGVDEKEKKRFCESLPMRDVAFLLREFEQADCGVRTDIEIECPECATEFSVELPFEASFFLPSAKAR